MSHKEYISWRMYIEKRGSMNTGTRLDRGFALIATIMSRALGGKAEMTDFMPHMEKPKEEASIMAVFGMLKTKAKQKAK
jgi:hypothetical protein